MTSLKLEANLSNARVNELNKDVQLFGYDRAEVEIGIVHFGPGAFHRAHQAVYTDAVLKRGEKSWGICAVSINSADVRDALVGQDNLYTLAVLDHQPSHQIVGSIKEILVATENPALVIARLAQETIKVVTLTITEKGYCLTPEGGLDFNNRNIEHDISHPDSPRSAIGYLVAGLYARWVKGIPPFAVLSCDNLTDNGKRLRRAVTEFAQKIDDEFSKWVKRSVKFPCSMVDSITPATNDVVRGAVASAIGFQDAWPIQRERFTQWVIEDLDGMQLPPWKDVGVTFSKDVRGYEATKLRILNGLHSSLAFVGILAGIDNVRDATLHPEIRRFIEAELTSEIIPTLPLVDGLNSAEYGASILARFENPAIRHLLSQIAWDSSQKIPFRILGTISDNLASGKRSPRLCFVIAAWMKFICYKVKNGSPITDAYSAELTKIGEVCNGSANDVQMFLGLNNMFSVALRNDKTFVEDVTSSYLLIGDKEGSAFTALLSVFDQ